MKYYIASSLMNAGVVKEHIEILNALGYELTYDWTSHGKITEEEYGDNWLAKLKEVGIQERDGVLNAEMIIMIMPARAGSHVELGIAIAQNKPVYILTYDVEYEVKTFYHLDNVRIHKNIQELLKDIL